MSFRSIWLLLAVSLLLPACTQEQQSPPLGSVELAAGPAKPDGAQCKRDNQCASGLCLFRICQPAPAGQCGDGIVQSGEGCDDGNQSNTDACPDGPGGSCQPASCGDGFVHSGNEACDGDGNGSAGETASCDSDCTTASCGDGTLNTSAGESCDDGNQSNSDNCADGPGGSCQAASCTDSLTSGDETDVDCGGSSCMPCADGDSCLLATDCTSGVCSGGSCQPASCTDGVSNGDETDIDCGGSCAACGDGNACVLAGDCSSGVCSGGSCQAPGCNDGVTNGDETDTDCGGSACASCASGESCLVSSDCDSGVCSGGSCQSGQCGDGVVQAGEGCDDGNQSNSDACPDGPGGSCQPATCGDGFVLNFGETCDGDGNGNGGETASCDSDCTVASCGDGTLNASAGESCDDGNQSNADSCTDGPGGSCQASTCSDGLTSGDETDVDCGGSCTSCGTGNTCLVAGDCSSSVCNGGVCQAVGCNDGVANGDETDTDCGGSTCLPCDDSDTCLLDADCTSSVCSGGVCQAASCSDSVANGDESDIDCGGSSCASCADGESCLQGSDCDSGVCSSGLCQTSGGTDLSDDFAGNGNLSGWTMHYRDMFQSAVNPLPDVTRTNGRYRAHVTNNSSNQTLFYNQDEGRIDYKPVTFPFTVVARNIGVGTQSDSQIAPTPPSAPQEAYIFSGIQIHVPEFYDSVVDGNDYSKISSAHAVVGHRGLNTYTLEGKTTLGGSSSTNDAGQGVAPAGRLDLRIVGKADFTLEVSWQQPNPNPGVQPDNWTLYRGTGVLPGSLPNFGDPAYGGTAYVGFVTYAYYTQAVPFVGTCDGIEIVQDGAGCQGGCCSDGVQNGDETDIDCGGSCPTCSIGDACVLNSDCSSALCSGGYCQSGECGDGIVQVAAGESCDDGNTSNNDDCLNNCQLPSCGDGFVHNQQSGFELCDGDGNGNGGETASCDSDCTIASCGDGTLNTSAGESCDDGNQSNLDSCTDGPGGSCQPASCIDGLTSGDESDVDCGGSSCATCSLGSTCLLNSDCSSALCSGGICQASLSDDFAGDGTLLGWAMHYRDMFQSAPNPLPDVTRTDGRYRANLTNNSSNQTLFYHQDEGRIDYKPVTFPFTVIARNIGIGTQSNSQIAPTPPSAPQEAYIFSGLQVHVPEFYDSTVDGNDYSSISSAHVVVGHRGLNTYTIEGKTTYNGYSTVNDDGQGAAPAGRLDIRIIGHADFTLEVSWQQPNPAPGVLPDSWTPYRGTGVLPGTLPNFADPAYGGVAYVGFVTYAFYTQLVPFVGTCDAIEIIEH